jgi:hypothetical protein
MVIFRTESGEVKILEAYCPHMGAHLGYGIHRVKPSSARSTGGVSMARVCARRYPTRKTCRQKSRTSSA